MNYHGPKYKKYCVEFTSEQETVIRLNVPMPDYPMQVQLVGRDRLVETLNNLKHPVMRTVVNPPMGALNDDLRVLPWWVV